jgi:Glycosyl hydrolases family 35
MDSAAAMDRCFQVTGCVHEIDQTQWAILGHGGGGYNFYMIHGGTNFGSWNDEETGASYDYAAAIGQAGDLRPMYYKMKRANQIGQSQMTTVTFTDIREKPGGSRFQEILRP